ncbi:MAG: ABC transporter substrate-binding protein [Bacteroidota bacterium]
MRTYGIVLLLLGLTMAPALAQEPTDFQARYRTAKELLREGSYSLAMEAFRAIAQEESPTNVFVAYAAYYQGLAALLDGQGELASNLWGRLVGKYPNWRDQKEVAFWQGTMAFAQGKMGDGYRALEQMKPGTQRDALEKVKSYYILQETDVRVLQRLFEEYSEDRELAVHLADCIVMQPMVQQNQELLEFLIGDFDLDPSTYNRITPGQSVIKEKYRVAILFPFQHEVLSQLRPTSIRPFYQGLLDRYEGMRMAVDSLAEDGKTIDLVAYDTKGDSATTANILALPEMKSVDLIIGPLFSEARELALKFSEENRILLFNPLSSNSEVIGNNPFAFLVNPSHETRARRVADYYTENSTDSTVYIFYGTRAQDSLYAYAYKAEMELRGFWVPVMMKVDEDQSQAGFEFLTETVRYTELVTLDSMRAADLYRDYLERKRDNPNLRLEKEEAFRIPNDSIGHILVASDNGLIAASIVGAIETRAAKGDSIPVVGTEQWLLKDFKFISYEQLERLGVTLTAPTYFEKQTQEVQDFQEAYIRRQNILPSREVFEGYDMLWFLGNMLHDHGTYFQFGMSDRELIPGNFVQGYNFRGANDNQVVPLLRFRDFQFEVISTQDEE